MEFQLISFKNENDSFQFQLYRPGTGPNDIPESNFVDDWNTYFFDDVKFLNRVWPHVGKNGQSLAELWLGFLRFYTEKFDFDQNVICIRQLEPLSKFEKNWTDRMICIEDPFLLSHNLGGGLSRRSN